MTGVLRLALLLWLLLACAASAAPATPDERAEDVLARARVLIEQGELGGAEDALRLALQTWPEHHDLHVLAGWTAAWGGRPAAAVSDFEAARSLAPDSLDAWDGLARAFAMMGRTRASRDALGRAQSLDPDPRSKEERALAVRWLAGDQAGAQITARALEARDGASELTDSITMTPLGFEGRGWLNLSLRQEGPLARVGTELRVQPHRLFRFSLHAEGSTWLGDVELQVGGGAQLLTPQGFSLAVHGGFGTPGVREPVGTVGLGLGWRIARIVELEAGWTLRRWLRGTSLHLLRLGATLELPRGTRLGGTFYMGLVRPALDPRLRPAPGARVHVHQPVIDAIAVQGSYAVGTEIIVHPFSRTEDSLVTHELKLGVAVQATARLDFSAAYALMAWSGRPPFHGLHCEVRTVW